MFEAKGQCGVFKKGLQAEETEDIGFLLFTTFQHDKKRLRASIQARTQESYNSTPEIALRWRNIVDPTKAFRKKGNTKDASSGVSKPVQAIQI